MLQPRDVWSPPAAAGQAREVVVTVPKKKAAVDLHAAGARVVSVFGPFSSRVLIEMPVDAAAEMFPGPLSDSAQTNLVEAVERDLDAIRQRDAGLAGSALAAAALRLAYELEHPYNSATSKSMCAKELRETMLRLRDLAPPEVTKDGIDQLAERRSSRRRAGGAAAKDSSRS